MTLPDERSRAIRWARELLRDLLDRSKTPGVPKEIRERAYSALRHYPADYHVNYAADGAPDHFDHLEEDGDSLWGGVSAADLAKKTKKKPKKKAKVKKK